MKKATLFLLFFFLLCAAARAQVTTRSAGKIIGGANLPATCSPATTAIAADVFIKTGSGAGMYFCTSANTWTQVSGGVRALAAQFNAAATTTYATITNFSIPVRAGRTYHITADLVIDKDTTGLAKVRFSGTATMTSFAVGYLTLNRLDNSTVGVGEAAFSADITEGFASGTGVGYHLRISGSCVVNAGGTLDLQFAQQVASGTSFVNPFNSTIQVIEVY